MILRLIQFCFVIHLACKIIKNITRVDSCDLKCCGEDLCDPSSANRPGFPSVFAASCATILWAFFFDIFT